MIKYYNEKIYKCADSLKYLLTEIIGIGKDSIEYIISNKILFNKDTLFLSISDIHTIYIKSNRKIKHILLCAALFHIDINTIDVCDRDITRNIIIHSTMLKDYLDNETKKNI